MSKYNCNCYGFIVCYCIYSKVHVTYFAFIEVNVAIFADRMMLQNSKYDFHYASPGATSGYDLAKT